MPSPPRFLLPLLAVFITGCASWHEASSANDTAALGKLMVERLGWMADVARVKQAKSLPITDPKREAELLKAMEQEGLAAGLPAKAVKAFFSGQMEAARVEQAEWIKRHPHPAKQEAPLPDLAKTVRPALDQIGRKMIARLVRARAAGNVGAVIAEARRQLTAPLYSEAVIAPALRGLKAGLRE